MQNARSLSPPSLFRSLQRLIVARLNHQARISILSRIFALEFKTSVGLSRNISSAYCILVRAIEREFFFLPFSARGGTVMSGLIFVKGIRQFPRSFAAVDRERNPT